MRRDARASTSRATSSIRRFGRLSTGASRPRSGPSAARWRRSAPPRETATVYTVEIPSAAGELVLDNNRRSVLVEPPGRSRRVLIVEGAPGFEHTFLKRALVADPGIEG